MDWIRTCIEWYKRDGLIGSDYEIKLTKLPRKKKKQAKKNNEFHYTVNLYI